MARIAAVWVVLGFLGFGGGVFADPAGGEQEVIAAKVYSAPDRHQPSFPEGTYIVESAGRFREVQVENPNVPGGFVPVPEGVDFSSVRLAVISVWLSSGSDALEIVQVLRVGDRYRIEYRVRTAAIGTTGTADMAYDTSLVEIPCDGLEIDFAHLSDEPR